jgi:3-hydroxy-3-methylglutaryl CoA synthase
MRLRTFLFCLLAALALSPVPALAGPKGEKVHQRKIDREKKKRDKEAVKQYEQALKQHHKNQSPETRAMMKSSRKAAIRDNKRRR